MMPMASVASERISTCLIMFVLRANALVQLQAHLTCARSAQSKSACLLQCSLGSVTSIDTVLAQYTLFHIVNCGALVADAVRNTVGSQRKW